MRNILELTEGFSIERTHIAVVRSADKGKKCIVFTPGQSAADAGFLVDQKYDVVMDAIHGPENDVIEAARRLLQVLDQAAPHMQTLAEIAASVGKPYTGTNFADEIEDLRIALAQTE